MRQLFVAFGLAAGCAVANPILITYLNEFGTGPDGAWVELHENGWSRGPLRTDSYLLVTSTSVCTLTCAIGPDSFIVIDSADLAAGRHGRGTFRLNPDNDSIMVIHLVYGVVDGVRYEESPTGNGNAPRPPLNGSASFWTRDYDWQEFNWYVDSTPTPGDSNDDYSIISGRVTDSSGRRVTGGLVMASGRNGECWGPLGSDGRYRIGGLGAGRYEVTLWRGSEVLARHPDSVAVGYDDTTAVDFMTNRLPYGIADGVSPSGPLHLLVIGSGLTLNVAHQTDAELVLFDAAGRTAVRLERGRLPPGSYHFRLPGSLPAGVYFARLSAREFHATVKVVLTR